ncbi:tripartite tricarboxylate transporter substrate-binding protein [Rhodoplanes sp.]|uniref:tripartite tricarboxylate transporter substrate-binding protein n=1 Tax=Rhodoplanes sp. TaxID=1968906 RepID=UPI0025E92C21|nr:tripartite tricarboxylate transporter substrate-binding protein [Rhodoplanes sp.]
MLAATTATAFGQAYPSRPITIVVPFSAGGPTDTIARIFAERMRVTLGQPVIVENTTGAGGSIGVTRVVRATGDGYTFGIGHVGTHVINGAIYNLPFDLVKDLEPIAVIASNPQILVGRKTLPAQNLAELLVWMKANSGKITFGTSGAGTPSHVSSLALQSRLGVQGQIIPYRGSGPALQDVMAGQIDVLFEQAANAVPQVMGGTVRAFAVTSNERLPATPQVPTTDEAGLPGFYMSIWHAFWAPKGTPKEAIAKLAAAVQAALKEPETKRRLGELGQAIPDASLQTAEGLGAYHKAEIDKWWPLVKAADIKMD